MPLTRGAPDGTPWYVRSMVTPPLPFTFRVPPPPVTSWRARWEARRFYVDVAGDASGPFPDHLAALARLVHDFAGVEAALRAFLTGLAPDHLVPLQAGNGGFAARNCGFHEDDLGYQYLLVTEPDAPDRATLGFCTGLPDGYAMYEVELVDGRPVSVSAFPS